MASDIRYPFFMHLCWFLNTLRLYGLAAGLRWWVCNTTTMAGKFLTPPPLLWKHYDHPEEVGYRGWVEHAKHGVLAFVRMDDSLQFMW